MFLNVFSNLPWGCIVFVSFCGAGDQIQKLAHVTLTLWATSPTQGYTDFIVEKNNSSFEIN